MIETPCPESHFKYIHYNKASSSSVVRMVGGPFFFVRVLPSSQFAMVVLLIPNCMEHLLREGPFSCACRAFSISCFVHDSFVQLVSFFDGFGTTPSIFGSG